MSADHDTLEIERARLRASRGVLRAGVAVAITVTILLLTQAAHAAEISVATEGRPGYPAIILIKGKLEKETFREDIAAFQSIADKQRDGAIVQLESIGGSVAAATGIGAIVHNKGFSTVVADNAVCSSSCGKERFLGPRARVGFHGAKDINTGDVSSVGNAIIGAYLYSIGVTDYQTIASLVIASPKEMTWVTPENVKKLKIEIRPLRGDLAMRTTRR
jgi:hypothetical protein